MIWRGKTRISLFYLWCLHTSFRHLSTIQQQTTCPDSHWPEKRKFCLSYKQHTCKYNWQMFPKSRTIHFMLSCNLTVVYMQHNLYIQGSILTITRLPGTSKIWLRASEICLEVQLLISNACLPSVLEHVVYKGNTEPWYQSLDLLIASHVSNHLNSEHKLYDTHQFDGEIHCDTSGFGQRLVVKW